MNLIEKILRERPAFHLGETEIVRPFDDAESLLGAKQLQQLRSNERVCYGLDVPVLRFLAENTRPGAKTLETGAGCSTLIFAASNARHTAVTPSETEIRLITEYCLQNGIPVEQLNLVQEASDYFLPRNGDTGYQIVLLDGKHAFPWPAIDWFYTADKLAKGGLMVVDDVAMRSVSLLTDFMLADRAWELVENFDGKTMVFLKKQDRALDVAWHMQPYSRKKETVVAKFKHKLREIWPGK